MEKNHNYENIALKLFIASHALFIFYEPLGIPVVFNMLLWTSAIFVLLLNRKMARINGILAGVLCFSILVILNIRGTEYISRGSYYLIAMLVSVLFLLLFTESENNLNKNYSIFILPAVISGCLIWIYKIVPSVYFSIVEPLMKPEHLAYNQHLIREGYAPSLGYEIGVTADCIVLSLFFIISEYKKKKLRVILFLFLFSSLVFLGRRGELLAFFASVVLFVFICINRQKKAAVLMSIFISVVLGLIMCLVIQGVLVDYKGTNRYLMTFSELLSGEDIMNGRLGLYVTAVELFKEHILFGIGWGGFAEEGRKIIDIVSNVHNIYLQLFCEVGIFGALCIISILLSIFFASGKALVSEKDGERKTVLRFSFLVQTYILTKGIMDNSIYYSNFWILYAVTVLPLIQDNWKKSRVKLYF